MRLVSLNVGRPVLLSDGGKELTTGIYKKAVQGTVRLGKTNLEGDGQADLVNHGGPDKAVCVYCAEHYPFWEERLRRKLEYGAFGENFTVEGLTEPEVHIGDLFEIGDALVQVTQPRQPCFKLALRHGVEDLAAQVALSGYTGYYFRVVREGTVEAGQPLRLKQRHPLGISVAEANRLKYRDRQDKEAILRLLEVDALSDSWRESFRKRVSG